MVKKGIIVLFVLAFVAGGLFAQIEFADMAKNTATIDFGPTIIGAAIKGVGNLIADEGGDGLSSSGFGFGVQYERQLLERVTVAGRFAYLGGGLGMVDDGVSAEVKLSSFSIEGHGRYYPMKGTFFLDGMLGFANLSTTLSGGFKGDSGTTYTETYKLSRGFFKLGAKLGWRICFGRNGGVVFEPAFGYYAGLGLGKTIGQKMSDEIGEDISEVDILFKMIQNFVFIGGPRVTLALGYRF